MTTVFICCITRRCSSYRAIRSSSSMEIWNLVTCTSLINPCSCINSWSLATLLLTSGRESGMPTEEARRCLSCVLALAYRLFHCFTSSSSRWTSWVSFSSRSQLEWLCSDNVLISMRNVDASRLTSSVTCCCSCSSVCSVWCLVSRSANRTCSSESPPLPPRRDASS